MKYYYLLFLIGSISFINCRSDQGRSAVNSTFTIFADSLFQTQVDSGRIAGAAVMVVQDGAVLLDKAYGFASVELSVPMRPDHSFEIGSVTKQFTAAAILQLVEQGKLSLSDDLRDYIDFDTGGRTITIQQLLNHTSGIPSYTEIPEFWDLSIRSLPRDTLLKLVAQNEFLFEPGEALIYNNSAYFLLGLIIEEVSGMTYDAYVDEYIFTPLSMNNSYYCSQSKIVPDKAYGYSFSNEGMIQKEYLDHTWPYAAGSLCSTTADLFTWMKAIHEEQFLSESTYKLLIEPTTLNDGTPVRYASGMTNFSNHGYHSIAHGGGINGFLSDTRYFPDEKLYIICLVNTTGPMGASPLANELTWKLLNKQEQPNVALDIDLDSLVGDYEGQIRGRSIKVSLSKGEQGLVQKVEGEEGEEILNYQGNNTWYSGNDRHTVRDGTYHIDVVSGHYILKKVGS